MDRVLLIEDDITISKVIGAALEDMYSVKSVSSAMDGINCYSEGMFDIVLLDLGLPDMDGIDALRVLRKWRDCSLIIISARDEDKMKVRALDIGADDYITKPFSLDELRARIRAVMRRKNRCSNIRTFENGDLFIDYDAHEVSVEGASVHLTPLEFKLIEYLSMNCGRCLTYSMMLSEVWGIKSVDDYSLSTLRVFMANLRRKIEKSPNCPRYIVTVLGVGYKLVDLS